MAERGAYGTLAGLAEVRESDDQSTTRIVLLLYLSVRERLVLRR